MQKIKKRQKEEETLQRQDTLQRQHGKLLMETSQQQDNDDNGAMTVHPINDDINAPDNKFDITQALP
eukprot:1510992-Ditylum_brightwellii.AAC.1